MKKIIFVVVFLITGICFGQIYRNEIAKYSPKTVFQKGDRILIIKNPKTFTKSAKTEIIADWTIQGSSYSARVIISGEQK